MADVEDDAALLRLEQIGADFPARVEHRDRSQIGMRIDVARPEVLQYQIFKRPLRAEGAEVHHHRHLRQLARLDGPVHRIPFGAPVVGGLDADNHLRMLPDPHHRQARIHVGEILLERSSFHAGPDDVDEGEHAREGTIDDLPLELIEVAPARAAGVHDRRHAGARRVRVWLDGHVAVAQIGIVSVP